MNYRRYIKYGRKKRTESSGLTVRKLWRRLICLGLRRCLMLALAGNVFLAGCSAGGAEDSGPAWSFQAAAGREESSESEGREDGASAVRPDDAGAPGGQDSGLSQNLGAEENQDSGLSQDPGAEENQGSGLSQNPGAGKDRSSASLQNSEAEGDQDSGLSQNPETPETEPGYVYVCGAVARPGVYEIGEGTRVFEVIGQAGGLTDQADAEWLNQAEIVLDGQKLQVYTKEETAAFREAGLTAPEEMPAQRAAAAGDSRDGNASDPAGDTKVNINTADKELLMTLPGIGESKAEAILSYRQEHGNFGSVSEICQVSGIKEAVFSKIEDRITV